MGRAGELMAGLLAARRREKEYFAALLDGMRREDSSDDEDEVEEIWTIEDIQEEVHALNARLCGVEARLDGTAAAEPQQQSVGTVRVVVDVIEMVPIIYFM